MAGAGRRGRRRCSPSAKGASLATPSSWRSWPDGSPPGASCARAPSARPLAAPSRGSFPSRAAPPSPRSPACPTGIWSWWQAQWTVAVNEPGGTAYRRRITGEGNGGWRARPAPAKCAASAAPSATSVLSRTKTCLGGGATTPSSSATPRSPARASLPPPSWSMAVGARRSPLPSCATLLLYAQRNVRLASLGGSGGRG